MKTIHKVLLLALSEYFLIGAALTTSALLTDMQNINSTPLGLQIGIIGLFVFLLIAVFIRVYVEENKDNTRSKNTS